MAPSRTKRFLIVGPSWVGDMIMSQSLYSLLRSRYPGATIDVLAPRASLPLVGRMPEVDRGIVMKTGHGELGFGYRIGLGSQLAKNAYSNAIILPNSLKSALVPAFAGIPTRTGFRGEYRYFLINDMRLLNERRLPRMVDRFVALGVPADADLPDAPRPKLIVDEDNLQATCERLELDRSRPVLGLCPGAEFGDAKRWPESHFGALAEHAVSRGMQVWLFGGPGDVDVSGRVFDTIAPDRRAHCVDLAGETSLVEAIDLMSACAQVVSNDSGLMHMAAAVGVPIAVVYGSTSPGFTPPLSSTATIVSDNLSCSPCFERTCPLGHKNCLNQLSPDRLKPVIDAATR